MTAGTPLPTANTTSPALYRAGGYVLPQPVLAAGERRQLFLVPPYRPLTVQPSREAILLPLEATQEEANPRLPIRRVALERRLRSTKCLVVEVLVLFDDTLQRSIGNIGIASAQQQQCRQHAGKTSIAVLKRMDREEDHHEDGDDQQRVKCLLLYRLARPGDNLATTCSATSSTKDDAPYDAGRPERGDGITKSGPKSEANAANSRQAAPPITNSAAIQGLQLSHSVFTFHDLNRHFTSG